MDLKTGHLEERCHARIILLSLFTMKTFCILFQLNFSLFFLLFFFCVLAYENKEAFSERCSLVSGVVQCLVKTCEKYTEVNHFVLLSCSLYINFGRMFFYLSGGNYFQGKFYGEGKIF